jgi:hypothetical protein
MFPTKLKATALLVAMGTISAGALPAQKAPVRPSKGPVPAAKGKSGPTGELVKTEAKIAKIRALVRPQAGEHVTNMARIAWERDPWEAAVKAAREGKPVLAYGECAAGVPCGYG